MKINTLKRLFRWNCIYLFVISSTTCQQLKLYSLTIEAASSSEGLSISTTLHGITSQKTTIFTLVEEQKKILKISQGSQKPRIRSWNGDNYTEIYG
jgi:hypothetical protein